MHADIRRQSKCLGGLFIGGGVPRNHIQQITPLREVIEELTEHEFPGITYGIQLTTADVRDGGLSGCTMSESKSWGKYHAGSEMISVWGEATMTLPLLATGVFQKMGDELKKRKRRKFDLKKHLSI